MNIIMLFGSNSGEVYGDLRAFNQKYRKKTNKSKSACQA